MRTWQRRNGISFEANKKRKEKKLFSSDQRAVSSLLHMDSDANRRSLASDLQRIFLTWLWNCCGSACELQMPRKILSASTTPIGLMASRFTVGMQGDSGEFSTRKTIQTERDTMQNVNLLNFSWGVLKSFGTWLKASFFLTSPVSHSHFCEPVRMLTLVQYSLPIYWNGLSTI